MASAVNDAFEDLVNRARRRDHAALQQLFQQCRDELRAHAERELDSRLHVRFDASDIVQQTLLEAQRDLPSFRGSRSAEWWGWINHILENNIAEEVAKHLLAQKRDLRKERSLDQSNVHAGALKQLLEAQLSSPIRCAMRQEEKQMLGQAIEALPVAQREAIRMRYLREMSLAEIADVMGRTELAVAGLLKRGLTKLREACHFSNEGR
jgi:RNA polymerase sigma-70 factor, ECF subfamily